jgi:putative Mg2+ transporter-C (MgtC) family protein
MMDGITEGSLEVWRELTDLGEFKHIAKIVSRLLIAALLGGVLGFERESRGKNADMRMHILVALGAALFVMVPDLIGATTAAASHAQEISRVVQGLVAGVGFLGAGVIWHKDGEKQSKGLTTAAGIWLTAAIGMSAGVGRLALAMLATGLALLVLVVLPKLARPLQKPAEEARPAEEKKPPA